MTSNVLFVLLFLLALGDPIEHATGIEKRELLAKLAGNDDPFSMNVLKRADNTTKEKPNLVPSAFDARLVGCICEEDQTFINWMWLHQVRIFIFLHFRSKFLTFPLFRVKRNAVNAAIGLS